MSAIFSSALIVSAMMGLSSPKAEKRDQGCVLMPMMSSVKSAYKSMGVHLSSWALRVTAAIAGAQMVHKNNLLCTDNRSRLLVLMPIMA